MKKVLLLRSASVILNFTAVLCLPSPQLYGIPSSFSMELPTFPPVTGFSTELPSLPPVTGFLTELPNIYEFEQVPQFPVSERDFQLPASYEQSWQPSFKLTPQQTETEEPAKLQLTPQQVTGSIKNISQVWENPSKEAAQIEQNFSALSSNATQRQIEQAESTYFETMKDFPQKVIDTIAVAIITKGKELGSAEFSQAIKDIPQVLEKIPPNDKAWIEQNMLSLVKDATPEQIQQAEPNVLQIVKGSPPKDVDAIKAIITSKLKELRPIEGTGSIKNISQVLKSPTKEAAQLEQHFSALSSNATQRQIEQAETIYFETLKDLPQKVIDTIAPAIVTKGKELGSAEFTQATNDITQVLEKIPPNDKAWIEQNMLSLVKDATPEQIQQAEPDVLQTVKGFSPKDVNAIKAIITSKLKELSPSQVTTTIASTIKTPQAPNFSFFSYLANEGKKAINTISTHFL